MSSYLIMGWVVGMQFTGWGAALLPWLLAAGFDMVDYKSINILKLAIPMSILLQTHMLSSLTGALALVPMFTYGVIHSGEKLKMWRNAILSV
ncbi:cell division protein, partial [Enterococcus lactis]